MLHFALHWLTTNLAAVDREGGHSRVVAKIKPDNLIRFFDVRHRPQLTIRCDASASFLGNHIPRRERKHEDETTHTHDVSISKKPIE